MDGTQHFRLAGTAAIEKIDYDHVDGHNVIYWEDIEQVFPGVKHVKCNGVAVNLLRDSDRKRMTPHCIKYHPGVVLDVVLPASDENLSAAASRNRDVESDSKEDVTENQQDDTMIAWPLERIFESIQALSMGSKFGHQLVSSRPSVLQVQARSSISELESLIQTIGNGLVNRSNNQLTAIHEVRDNVMDIKDKASMILELVFENMELTAHVLDLQEEVKQLQLQALDRLPILQNSVKALLAQTYELHEYPIPRLFIVLPQDSSNPLDLFSNNFRLYFLCECGEHTMVTNSKIPHHIHLATHEGYEIERPNEFFRQYGSYILTILKMLKYGITAAGIAVPALSHLVRVDALDQATESLKSLTNTIEPGMNQVINHIEKVSADALVEAGQQMENNEALEGADLRQLEAFLKNKDNNIVLGNLYRTVTTEGHVKWVCIDHYRENYHEKVAEVFRNAVKAQQGLFDEAIGRVEVKLRSRLLAEQFYLALVKARSVYELVLELDWETSQSDFKKLHDTLAITNVGVLELHLAQQGVPTRDILNRNQRFDPVLDILRHRSIQSFAIRGPCDFTNWSSLLYHNYDFSNLRHLNISLEQFRDDPAGIKCLIAKSLSLSSLTIGSGSTQAPPSETVGDLVVPPTLRHLDIPLYQLKDDIPGAKRLITNASNLSSLTLRTGPIGTDPLRIDERYVLEVYRAITEHRNYSIDFKDWGFYLPPPPPMESNQSTAAIQYMEHLLKLQCHFGGRVDRDMKRLKLKGEWYDELVVHAMIKTTKNDSALESLEVRQPHQLSDPFINLISSMVAQSELSQIEIYTRGDEGRLRILESIQWKHLRWLYVELNPGTFEMRVMRALVDGVAKMSGKVGLERFDFLSETSTPLTLSEGNLLQTFVASTAIESLGLKVEMTLEQILSLLRSADVSRLDYLRLWTKGFDSDQVDAILERLQHATKLKTLILSHAYITDEQKKRMRERRTSLYNSL